MKTQILAAMLAASAFAAPAFAAPVSGGRVEAIIGYDMSRVEAFDLGIDGFDDKEGGLLYGIGAGYDFPVGGTTSVGIDAEVTEAGTNWRIAGGGDSVSVDIGRDLYVGGRITTAVSDSFNVYGKAGFTNTRVSADISLDGDIANEGGNADGWRLGAGGQFAVGQNAFVGVEYRYSNYEADFSRHQVVGSLGFRF